MKLKIEITQDQLNNLEELNSLQNIWLILLTMVIIFNFISFVSWNYPLELLRFTIWVLVINAFIFIRIE
jgi:hypothetical protein